jgi:major vault protein
MSGESVIRIKPQFYIHVLDNNTNVTRVIVGPRTFTRQDHEKIVAGPEAMVTVPPRNYCRISNPVIRDPKTGEPLLDQFKQYRIRHGDEEIRFAQDPFPLFPGEQLKEKPQPLAVVAVNNALRLRALRDFVDEKGVKRVAGDEWLFRGPATYTPRIEESVAEKVTAMIIKDNEAVKLRAKSDFTDSSGLKRVAGEQWMVRTSGAFLPDVLEEVLGTVKAVVLTPVTALHLVATGTFEDIFGRKRLAGQEWLVTMADCETYIPDIYEQVKGAVKITTLTNRQFCVVLDPLVQGRQRFGSRELRRGETSFFLFPGERLEKGIQDVYVLAEEEALLLRAREAVTIGKEAHKPGNRWMIYGPCDFIPPIEVEVVERRKMIPLDENEGIYVRDITTGKVRSVIGRSYMLKPNEELWAKPLTPEVEIMLSKDASRDKKDQGSGKDRDPTRVVSYRVPSGAAVQVFDYETKKSRVVFGPELVLLQPDEHFTTLNLSGDVPKKSSQFQTIALFLGPDFMADQITVETADHARLSLKLSYNWQFEVDQSSPESTQRIFSTPDFVGDLCKALSARVRGAVASQGFDAFHKHSVEIIQEAVFGRDKEGVLLDKLRFPSNGLVVTNIDIQSVEPVDQKTRDSLQKSVQLAIEITTKSQEASARQEAERLDQEARGRLERQKLQDEAEAEDSRKRLLKLQSESATVEASGHAAAEARGRAEAALIEGEAAVKRSELEAKSSTITSVATLDEVKGKQTLELAHRKKMDDLEIKKKRDLAEIESDKFAQVVEAIGPQTIRAIAQAGPEMQAKLLNSLGLKSLMITDGNSPINLFNTASGLVGGAGSSAQ